MRIVGNNPQLSRQTQATASGAITGGKPVVVNTDGTVTEISESAQALGSESEFTTGAANYINIVHDSDSGKSVVIYRDDDAKGTARVGTISGTDISYGTAVEFEQGNTEFIAATFDSNSNKVVIAYRDTDDSNYGKAVVGTVSGTDISFGSAVTFESAHAAYMSATFDSTNNKVVIVYCDLGNSNYGTAVVGTVSGTSISFGTPVVYSSSATYWQSVGFDTANGKVVINYDTTTTIYIGGGSATGLGIVGTVSGTSISFGTRAGWMNGGQLYPDIAYDSDSGKFLFVSANGSTNRGEATVATVSGTSISFGTVAVYETGTANYSQVVIDTATNKAVVAFRDQGDSNKGKFNVGTISGTDVSFSGVTEFNAATEWIGIEYDSTSEKVLIGYRDQGDGDDGTVRVLQNAVPTNLTSENFIGFAEDTVATGQPVTINTKGAIADNMPQVASASDSLGSATVFESGVVGEGGAGTVATFDSSNNRVIVAYSDQGNSSYGTVCVGTVSGTTITFGTPSVIESAYLLNFGITFDSNLNKVVIVYTHQPTSETGKAIVGTIDSSDNSISFGTAATFDSNANNSRNSVAFDSSNNKVAIVYRDWGNNQYGTAKVGTVSGTDISFGSAAVFENADSQYIKCAFDSSNNKVVIAYQDDGNSSYGTAIVGTISGTSISFGTAVVFESASTRDIDITFDSSNNKVVIVYHDAGNSGHGTSVIGTVSGTGISFGSAVVFEAADTEDISTAFDSNLNKVVVSYYDDADSDYGKYIIGTVSGTSISYGSAVTFNEATTKYTSTAFDSNENKTVIFYRDDGDSSKGKGIVLAPAGTPEDLTIGQQYFVQTDGTLGTSADDPSVIAGTAIGASDIIVKG